MKMSEYIKLNKIPKYNIFEEWYTLNDEQFEILEKAVIKYLPTKLKNVNYNTGSSYYLKHKFEKLLGFYISNYDMKLVMAKLEYKVGTRNFPFECKNLKYNISKRELKILESITDKK